MLVHGEAERTTWWNTRRTAGRICVQYFRLGSILRVALREAAHPVWRHQPSPPDDGGVIAYAESLTRKPMKGMLTGPVTILNWSFLRDDEPRSASCEQLAPAIRQEVLDLEQAGVAIIQIDEAALREGLPLRRAQWKAYLQWAVESFRITAMACATRRRSIPICAIRSSTTLSRRLRTWMLT